MLDYDWWNGYVKGKYGTQTARHLVSVKFAVIRLLRQILLFFTIYGIIRVIIIIIAMGKYRKKDKFICS